ncbi:MAG: hypothetical protein COA82_12380 [Alkaliphilus sp.]|nr:hypothetical protein [bacterium AH-315-L21]PHS29723.1 MAG: hypothetical protein COA82_12380 [Alkaliphilus sp.]
MKNTEKSTKKIITFKQVIIQAFYWIIAATVVGIIYSFVSSLEILHSINISLYVAAVLHIAYSIIPKEITVNLRKGRKMFEPEEIDKTMAKKERKLKNAELNFSRAAIVLASAVIVDFLRFYL